MDANPLPSGCEPNMLSLHHHTAMSYCKMDVSTLLLGVYIIYLPCVVVCSTTNCTVTGTQADCHLLKLTSIPDNLQTYILHLDLHNNIITGINPGELQRYPYLTTLDLNFNHISWIRPGTFANLSALVDLDLTKNYLTTCLYSLPPRAFIGLSGLKTITVASQASEKDLYPIC